MAAKKLTQSQADDMLANLKSHIDNVANGALRFRGPDGPGGPRLERRLRRRQAVGAAAKYLGLSDSDLRAKLRAGDSLADVAKAQGKDVGGLQDAIVAAQKAELDKAVADKKLTQSQADDVLGALKERVDDLVNAKPGDRPHLRQHERGGPRFLLGP